MKKVLVWESHSMVSGGQKMTLLITDLLKGEIEPFYLIPQKGALSASLDERGLVYYMLGNQSLPAGVKGKAVIPLYVMMSIKAIFKGIKYIVKEKPDIIYAPGPAALPWAAICGSITHKPVVWHLHHNFLDNATKKLLNICSGFRSVKHIIAVSQCVGEQISNQKGKSKVEVIYNPVDVKKYESGNAENIRKEVEEALGRKINVGGYTRPD